MAFLRALPRLLFRIAVVLAAVILLAGVLLTKTPLGRSWVLLQVLTRVEAAVNGELVVESVSSPGLLRGFTLRGVRIEDPGGRPFLLADSLRAGLSAPALLRGDFVFAGVEVWRPRVVLEQLPGEDRLNVMRIFFPEEGAETPAGEGGDREGTGIEEEGGEEGSMRNARTIALRDVTLHQGSLDVLLPLPEGAAPRPGILLAQGPDGTSSLRRYSFREIELELTEGVLRSPRRRGQRFDVRDLSFVGEIWPDPFRITGLRGRVNREGPGIIASLESLSLPSSQARGQVEVTWGQGGGVRVEVDGEAKDLELADLRFLDGRLPRALARGPFGLTLDDRGTLIDFRETSVALESGELQANGGLLLGRQLGLRELELEMEFVDLSLVEPWVSSPLPLEGNLTGSLSLDGTPAELAVDGDLVFIDAESTGSSHALITGLFHLDQVFGVDDLNATLAPLEWSTLGRLSPVMKLTGPGALRVEASGSMDSGFQFSAEATYVPPGFAPSRVTARGSVGTEGSEAVLSVTGDLRPLSFTAMAQDYPELPVTGEVSGAISLRGPLSNLNLETELETAAGPLAIQARFDARDPARGYNLDTRAEDLLLSSLVPSLPEPTRVSGRVLASGRGLELDSLTGEATVYLHHGEVGHVAVDTAAMVLRVEQGLLRLDALMAETGLGRVEAGGTFGVSSTSAPGELTVQVESDSISALRPWVFGEVPTVFEELSPFERDLLAVEGVDLDTLPRAVDVALDGRLQGAATFTGGIEEFQAEGSLAFQDLRYTTDFIRSGTLTFSARGLPGDDRRIEGVLRTDSLLLRSISFNEVSAEMEFGTSDGRARIVTHRSGGEEYRARGTFALDSLDGGVVNLDELTLRFDSVQWNLGGPTSVLWARDGVRVRDFRLIRPGVGYMRVRADGYLPLRGEGDFQLEVERLDLERLARVTQLDRVLEGLLDLDVRVTGPSNDPHLEGTLAGRNLRFGNLALTRLDSDFEYAGETLQGLIRAREGSRESFYLQGSFPADLRMEDHGPRIPERPVNLTLQVDSFPADMALSPVRALDDVQGTLSGRVELSGTPKDLAPRGELRLVRGAASLPALGVRHTGAEATLGLTPDRVVTVQGTLNSGGTAQVTGTVTLDTLTNPALELRMEARGFQAVNRRDLQGRVSGWMEVRDRYLRPRATGELTVEEGVLVVEELARSVEVVDLADPAFFDVVDTTLVTLQPIIRASQNPFLQNLRMDLDLSMSRGSWLRGREMNVEMAGQLDVYWDRTERDLAMSGDLEAVRGVYSVFGRQFQVQEGTVSFLGTPGINPNLNIEALYRGRTYDSDQRLDIIATVQGTLLSPRVSLSSDAPFPIAESDLVSYLVFGRPTYALASGQSTWADGAAGALLGAATGAGASLAVGSLSNEIGSVVTRGVGGLDYLAITQGQDAATLSTQGLAGTVATTQVEIGQYITPEIFAALTWRPLTRLGGSSRDQFAGFRVEWRLKDQWTLEAYAEDRFARSPVFLTGDLGPQLSTVFGFLFYRQWGY